MILQLLTKIIHIITVLTTLMLHIKQLLVKQPLMIKHNHLMLLLSEMLQFQLQIQIIKQLYHQHKLIKMLQFQLQLMRNHQLLRLFMIMLQSKHNLQTLQSKQRLTIKRQRIKQLNKKRKQLLMLQSKEQQPQQLTALSEQLTVIS